MRSGRVRILPRGMMDILRQGNLGALLLPLALLAVGGTARALLARKTVNFNWHGVILAHPTGWTIAERSADPAEGDSVVLMDLLGPGRIKPRVTLRIAPLPGAAGAPDQAIPAETGDRPNDVADAAAKTRAAASDGVQPAADGETGGAAADGARPAAEQTEPAAPSAIAETLSNRLPLYYAMGEHAVEIGGVHATRVDSAFAFTPRAVLKRKRDIPVVMRAIDLILLRGTDALSIQVAAPIEDFEAQRPTLEAMLASLRIDPAAAPTPTASTDAEPIAAAATTANEKAPAPGDVTVAGQVIDAESGLAIPGAIVLFLAPGTNVDDVTDDNLTQIAYTTGLADSTGHFASNRPLARAAHYGVMVVADGYRWIGIDDGVAVADSTPARLDVGTVRLQRR